MTASRFLVVALLAAAANAGVVPPFNAPPYAYTQPIAKITSPLPAAAPRLSYTAAAPTVYSAPVAKYSSPLSYAAPIGIAHHAAPLAYAPATVSHRYAPVAYAPAAVAHTAAPVAYASPVAKYAAPVAKYAAPVAYASAPVAKAVVDTDYDPNPSYSYAYDIQDALTGDSKSQHESRQGDSVQGSYTLIEPDGTRRTVEYTADPVNGFNAVVHREPAVQKAVVAAPVSKLAYAPVAKVAAAPLAYASPVAKAIAYPTYH